MDVGIMGRFFFSTPLPLICCASNPPTWWQFISLPNLPLLQKFKMAAKLPVKDTLSVWPLKYACTADYSGNWRRTQYYLKVTPPPSQKPWRGGNNVSPHFSFDGNIHHLIQLFSSRRTLEKARKDCSYENVRFSETLSQPSSQFKLGLNSFSGSLQYGAPLASFLWHEPRPCWLADARIWTETHFEDPSRHTTEGNELFIVNRVTVSIINSLSCEYGYDSEIALWKNKIRANLTILQLFHRARVCIVFKVRYKWSRGSSDEVNAGN